MQFIWNLPESDRQRNGAVAAAARDERKGRMRMRDHAPVVVTEAEQALPLPPHYRQLCPARLLTAVRRKMMKRLITRLFRELTRKFQNCITELIIAIIPFPEIQNTAKKISASSNLILPNGICTLI